MPPDTRHPDQAGQRGRTTVTGKARIRAALDILNDPAIRPRDPILGEWLLERGLALVYAPSGIGKSWFALSVALAAAGGGKVHDWQAPEARKVLLVDGEMDTADMKERLGVCLKATGLTPDEQRKAAQNLMVWSRRDQPDGVDFPDLGDGEGRDALLERVRIHRPALVILDNVSTLVTVAEENAAESWNPFLETLQALQQAGAAVLVVHHAKKAASGRGGYRGSQKLSVLFDTIMSLSDGRPGAEGASFLIQVEKSRRLIAGARDGVLAHLIHDPEGGPRWEFEARRDGRLHELVAVVRGREHVTQAEIAAHLGISEGQLSKDKREALKLGLITDEEWRRCLDEARTIRAEEDGEGEPF